MVYTTKVPTMGECSQGYQVWVANKWANDYNNQTSHAIEDIFIAHYVCITFEGLLVLVSLIVTSASTIFDVGNS